MKKISLLILLVVLSGCSVQKFHLSNDTALASEPKVEKTSQFFLSGIAPYDDINVISVCGGDVYKVSYIVSKKTFLDGLLNIISGGIYTPRTYEIYCKA